MNNEKYEQNIRYRTRKIYDKFYLFTNKDVFEINEIGVDIWNTFDNPKSFEEVLDEITELYEVNREKIKDEIFDFVKTLIEKKCIKKV